MSLSRRFLPSTSALRALEALDRLGSATAAASELDLTQSAVSRQLQSLEEQLGVPMFVRQGRRLVLTPEASDYAGVVRGALQKITQAALKLTMNPAGGGLNLAILPTFGMRWLVPRLGDFAQNHPDVTLNLSTRLKPFNFSEDPFDAAIHFGGPDWPGTQSLRLRAETVVAVCAPEVLESRVLHYASDLRALPLLHIETRPDAWEEWFAKHGVDTGHITGTIYDQFTTITQAALHGLGVALLPDYLAEQDLAAGRLVTAWGGPTPSDGAYHLVWPIEKSHDAALLKFREWLLGQTEEDDLLPR